MVEQTQIEYKCAFCEKNHKQVEKIILAPDNVTGICNDCVNACQMILLKHKIEKMNFKLVTSI